MIFLELIKVLAGARIALSLKNGKLGVDAPEGAVTPAIMAGLKEHKEQLIEHLRQGRMQAQAIQPAGRDGALPLSFPQQRLWLLDRIEGASARYNMPAAIRLTGRLDAGALRRAFCSLVARHESLRTCFAAGADGGALQDILPAPASFAVALTDLSHLPPAAREQQMAVHAQQEAARPFDLAADLMLRAALIKLAADEHILLVTMHHIASDGWSMAILIEEFGALYAAFTEGGADPLPPLAVQYADYAHWQRNWLQGALLDQQLGYWSEQLDNLPTVHGLALDRPRAPLQTFAGAVHASTIDAGRTGALKALCQQAGATLFMGLHAAFALLLARHSGDTDIVVGTPVANREQAEIARLIGFFVNTLVLRSDLSQDLSFAALLENSKNTLLAAYAHQQVPFEQVVEHLQPARSLSHSPLFQVMLVLQNNAQGELALPGLTMAQLEPGEVVAKYDLSLTAGERDGTLMLGWEYNTDLFDAATIARMAAHFDVLLGELLNAPQASVSHLSMLDAAERGQLLSHATGVAADYFDGCIHQLVEQHAARAPASVAVLADDESLDYATLNARANRLAHYLVRERGVGVDSLVGICVERSPEMIVAMLAVLKAGGAYVPLDPDYPCARLAFQLDDAALQTVITSAAVCQRTPVSAAQALVPDAAMLAAMPSTNPEIAGLNAQHLAYAIYTSGSTGNPKASLLTHAGLCNLAAAQQRELGLGCDSRVLQFASAAFDAATWEWCMALAAGAALVMLDAAAAKSPQAVSAAVARHQVTHATLPPVLLPLLDPALWTSVRTLVVAGEACPLPLAQRWAEGRTFINAYGPSEASVCATMGRFESGQDTLHMGRPIQNVQALVLDRDGQLCPAGVAGELHVGGVGLSRGYLNRAQLTAEKFITRRQDGARLYRTGDLVRWNAHGQLEFLGRIDHQVKLRGFRIELGEVEHALLAGGSVTEALVLARPGADGQQLVAYVVARGEAGALQATLRSQLSAALPDYMVPSAFVVLERMPLTPNGKVDRKALPLPDAASGGPGHIAPRTDTERALALLWQDILGAPRVGVHDNFFALGGHSLSATRLAARIGQTFGISVPIKTIFAAATLEQLALSLAPGAAGAAPAMLPAARGGALLPSYGQQRLWLLDQIDGGSSHYNMPAALKLGGRLDRGALESALRSLIARHESLRTTFASAADGQPVQVVGEPPAAWELALSDLSDLPAGERRTLAAQMAALEASAPFDLAADLMLRARLLKLAEEEHVLLITLHHIASDGWSMGILVNELGALYGAYSEGRGNPLPPLALQYADYAQWQRHWLQGEVLEQQLGYWTAQLAGLPVVHGVPLDHPRAALQSFAGARHESSVGSAACAALRALCQASGATLFMGLHAALAVLLARYSNETDIVIGSPIANREQPQVAGLIGFFANTLVLRSDLSANPGFDALLAQSRQRLLDAYAHQQVPFEQIVERLQPQRSFSHTPLFQVLLVLHNNEQGQIDLPGLTLSQDSQDGAVAKYELTLTVSEAAGGLLLGWEYNTDLFEPGTIARMARHFDVLLAGLVGAPAAPVLSLPMLDASEQAMALAAGGGALPDFASGKCIHELFEEQVARDPHAPAVSFEQAGLSYGELNERANALAHYLVAEKGVGPDTLVGLCVERSLDMMVGILAILKAGGAYVPLDPDYPAARLSYMLADARLATVLTQRHLIGKTPVDAAQAVVLDDPALGELLAAAPRTNIAPAAIGLKPGHIAYVIYTSGSTGNPKGVMVEHANVTRLFDAAECHFEFGPRDVWTMFHSYAFDFSVWEIWGALTKGGQLLIVPYWVSRSPADFYRMLSQQGVTVLNQTPSAFSNLIGEDAALAHQYPLALRYVVFGGEALNLAALLPWMERHGDDAPQLINMYGITETTVHVTYRRLTRAIIEQSAGASLIGEPLADLGLVILNAAQQLAPVGVAGEMYVGGAGVTRGYLNQPQLTASRFVTLPGMGERRFYRTGDLAVRMASGELAYLGRIDDQVKVRGFRIELGEIESVLTSCPGVQDAVVLARAFGGADLRLVAYVVDSGGDTAQRGEALRTALGASLPDYMLPSAFVFLDRLPLTGNGKVDRKALPEPDPAQQRGAYAQPATDAERVLAAIWQEVLGLEQVGRNDNFFQLGGHSLLVIQVISRLRAHGLELTVRQLFSSPTLFELAALAVPAGDAKAAFAAPPNLIPAGCPRLTPDMLPLVALSQPHIDTIVAAVPGGAANVQDIYPLAPLQEGILFHHRMSEASDAYVTPMLIKVASAAHLEGFLAGLQFVMNRYDVLRTAILWNGLPEPVQVVLRHAELPLTWLTLDPDQDSLAQMEALCAPERQWMDLGQAPLLRLRVARDAGSDALYVLMQLHHLIDDATSLGILQKEIAAFLTGRSADLPQPQPYREFVAYALHQGATHDAAAFFRRTLGDVSEPTAPFNLLDLAGDVGRIEEAAALVPGAVSALVRSLAREMMISPASLFHAAWAMVVGACSGRNDVVFGSVLSGRLQGMQNAENMLGMFINTLPLRVRLDGISAQALVRQVHEALLELLPYEQASLALAQRCSGVDGGAALFSSILNYRHASAPGAADGADTGFEYVTGQERTNYPFDLSVNDLGDGFGLNAQIDRSVGAQRILALMQCALTALVQALATEPSTALAALTIQPAGDMAQLLRAGAPAAGEFDRAACIHELFEAAAANTPDAVAVVRGDTQLSYAELNERANRLAHFLVAERGVAPDTLVGVCLERSPEMVIAILAILKAGAAYVPLDPEYPAARLAYMVQDAALATVLTERAVLERTGIGASLAVMLDDARIAARPPTNIARAALGLTPAHLAYVIYTSGSSGQPKGVMVEHCAFAFHVQAAIDSYGIAGGDRLLQFATISFDAAQEQLFCALASGAALHLRAPALWNAQQFFAYCLQHAITVADLPPSYCAELLNDTALSHPFFAASPMKTLILGGEALSDALVRQWHALPSGVALINAYGPTETVVTACSHRFERGQDQRVVIGTPFAGRQCYIVNHGQLAPAGVAGELLIGGVALARGYLNRPAMTDEKFIPNPFGSGRVYRSGDLARWNAAGQLEFLGRGDEQVKIRGFRVELGEIESALGEHPQVREAVVLARDGASRLVAYVVAQDGAIDLDERSASAQAARLELAATLHAHLAERLPAYMLPSACVLLARLPLTPNGKVDRKALPEPDGADLQSPFVAPQGATEESLCAIWAEVLGVERVGRSDNFFQLGGHSLSATRLLTRINQQMGLAFTLKSLFACRDAAAMAAALDELAAADRNARLAETTEQQLETEW